MSRIVDFSGRPFHFIGVGGIGMSALAYMLAKRQLPVSGSDRRLTHITNRLQENGVQIFWSQEADNIAQVTQRSARGDLLLPQVVCSKGRRSPSTLALSSRPSSAPTASSTTRASS